MAKKAEIKTNVMRILEREGIPYTPHEYPHGKEAVDGVTVARLLGQDPACVFKTLVLRGRSGEITVCVLPVGEELDLKKAAHAAGEKAVEMVHVREITGLTGYVRGGCSPVGMKKAYRTIFHQTAERVPRLIVSAGRIGYQVETAPAALIALVGGKCADITV